MLHKVPPFLAGRADRPKDSKSIKTKKISDSDEHNIENKAESDNRDPCQAVSHPLIQRKSIPSVENSKCKGSEAQMGRYKLGAGARVQQENGRVGEQ